VDLLDFHRILWRRKWILVATTIIAIAITLVVNVVIRPVYTATTLIRVSASPNPLADRADVQYSQRLMNTYTLIARTRPLLSEVIKNLDLKMSASRLEDMIEVKAIEETELIQLTVNNSDPKLASDIANDLANVLIAQTTAISGSEAASTAIQDQLNQIQKELAKMRGDYDKLTVENPTDTNRITELSREIVIKQQTYETLLQKFDAARLTEALRVSSITLVEPANPPREPTIPKRTLNLVLGTLLGVVSGVALVLLFNNIDTRVYTTSHIKKIVDLPIFAELGRAKRKQLKFADMPAQGREAYRRLRTTVFSLQKDNQLRNLMITSPEEAEGKSTVTYNLALSIVQLGYSTLIIDCDMRKPTQHMLLSLPNQVGLSTVLEKKVSIRDAIQASSVPNLDVLTSGPRVDDPTQLLASPYMNDLLLELAAKYDIVLLDTPAMLPVVDSATLAQVVDGVLMVVRCGKSKRETILEGQAQFSELRARLLGLVVNEAPIQPSVYHTAVANQT
jgi:capsular exopolysaccharide synthesis family protein